MARSKEQIIRRMNEVGHTTRICMGVCPNVRENIKELIDEKNRKIPFVIVSNNNAGERYDWWKDEVFIEELDVNGADLTPLETFFTDHRLSTENAIGRVENQRTDNGQIKADVVFGTDEKADAIFKKYLDGILTSVSIGYRVNDIVVTEKKDEPKHVLVTDYSIVELSAVWKGFDGGAKIGRDANTENTLQKRAKIVPVDILEKELKLKGKWI